MGGTIGQMENSEGQKEATNADRTNLNADRKMKADLAN